MTQPITVVAIISHENACIQSISDSLSAIRLTKVLVVDPSESPPASAHVAVLDARMADLVQRIGAYATAGCLVIVVAQGPCGIEFHQLCEAGADDIIELTSSQMAVSRRLDLAVQRSRRRQASSPRAHEEWFIQFMRHLPGVAFIKDAQSRCIYFNETFGRIFNAKLEDWYLTNDEDHWPPEIVAKFKQNDRYVIEKGVVLNSIELAPQSDGIHYYASSKFPIRDENGTPILVGGIAIDITEQRRHQEMANRAEELLRSNSELELFAHACSHDLREPLRMVSSFLNLLKRRLGTGLDEKSGEFLQLASDGALRMQEMISNLLAYACVGGDHAPSEPVDANKALSKALFNLQQVITDTDAQIESATLPMVAIGESQLVQIFQNLIANALKFCRDHKPSIHITSTVPANGAVEISIRDNGIGIESQFHQRIFEAFQRLNDTSEFQGSGLGLAICRKIIERLGGKIWVLSNPEEGSDFHFTLPTLPVASTGADPKPLLQRHE